MLVLRICCLALIPLELFLYLLFLRWVAADRRRDMEAIIANSPVVEVTFADDGSPIYTLKLQRNNPSETPK